MRLFAALILIPGIAFAGCLHNCEVDGTGFSLIKTFEGYSPFIYDDVVGVRTVGFGHAVLPGETIRTPLMGPDALALLKKDVTARTGKLNHIIKVELSPYQFDAISSWCYNVGLGNVERSTLLRRMNSGKHNEVPPQFLVWDKAGGLEMTGLRVRRKAEAALYRKGTQ